MEQAFEETREEASGVTGPVRIGTYTPVNCGPYLLEIVKTFESGYPGCEVLTRDTGLERDQFDWLRQGELDLLAMRLPVAQPDVTIGPILSREPRVLLVSRDHPLAERDSVGIEEIADFTVPYSPRLPREMIDAFVPPKTPSGRPLRRYEDFTASDVMTRVATGELVYLTVPSVLDHFHNPHVVGIPVPDLRMSETALVWLSAHTSTKTRAFVQVAAEILGRHGLGAAVGARALRDAPRSRTTTVRR
jgi:DNA-binding transcriptional LysR family regulator